MKQHVFVYGTLKRGYANHFLLADAQYLGDSELEGFELWDLGSYPGIRPSPRETARVHAELYETDSQILARLDALEDYFGPNDQRNLYDRIRTSDTNGKSAWVYVLRESALKTFILLRKAQLIHRASY